MTQPSTRLVIAVDGPAASGKGTLAAKLAAHFGLPHLDTGGLYRAVGKKTLAARGATQLTTDDAALAIEAASTLSPIDLAATDLAAEAIGQAASIVSAIPEVRAALFDYQRQFAAQPQGAVLDGRDIGTVICPDADIKLYITASPEVRAERRFKQQQAIDPNASYEAVLNDIRQRDARDMNRTTAPLKPAEDAKILNTSEMNIEQVLAAALSLITSKSI